MDTQQQPPNPNPNPAPHSNFLNEMEKFFDTYLHQKVAFKIPEQGKEWIVTYSPWIDVVLLVLALPVILAAFGLGLFVMPFAAVFAPFSSLYGIIHWLIALASFILQVAALPGLFHRSLRSWYLVYYAVLLSAVSSLLGRDIFGLIIGTAISLYILFQVREKYK